jgi:cytochrome c biogenesis protein CcmG/thiol:disulfide interchange protein DsbE
VARPKHGARMILARPSSIAILVLAAAFLALLGYGLTSSNPNDAIDSRLAEGRATTAPTFNLPVLQRGRLGHLSDRVAPALADGSLSLREVRGIPVVLNFWASWCPPCRKETPALQMAWRSLRQRGVLVLGLNMQDITSDAHKFLSEVRVSYPSARDRSDATAVKWGVVALPETFFIDRRGRVVAHVIGALSTKRLRAGVTAAQSGTPVGARSGGDRRPAR